MAERSKARTAVRRGPGSNLRAGRSFSDSRWMSKGGRGRRGGIMEEGTSFFKFSDPKDGAHSNFLPCNLTVNITGLTL